MDNLPETDAPEQWPVLDRWFQIGCAIILSSGILAFARERLLKLLSPTLSDQYLLDLLGIVLLITVVILVFRWIFAVYGEMRLLREYFRKRIRPQPSQVYVWTIFFSILLGALGYLTGNIIAFSAIFAVYSLGDIWGQHIRDKQLKEAFRQPTDEDSDDHAPPSKRQTIEHYYLDRPQMERSATIMFFSFVALSLALAGSASQSVAVTERLHAAAYAVIIANIVISEVVIWRWRKIRDAVLGEKYSF